MYNIDNPDCHEYVRNSTGAFARITEYTTRAEIWRFRTFHGDLIQTDCTAEKFKHMTHFISYIKDKLAKEK